MWFSNNIYLNAATGTADNIPEERGNIMKAWRIVYWFCSMMTERLVKADSKETAIARFAENYSKDNIVSIEEIQQ